MSYLQYLRCSCFWYWVSSVSLPLPPSASKNLTQSTVAIGIRYYKMSRQITTVFPLANRTTSKSLLVRVTIFNLGTVVVFAYVLFFSFPQFAISLLMTY